MIKALKGLRVSVRFAWYDIWVGVFVDTKKNRVYICPIPMLLITIEGER